MTRTDWKLSVEVSFMCGSTDIPALISVSSSKWQYECPAVTDIPALISVSSSKCHVWQYECPAVTDIPVLISVSNSLLQTVSATMKGMIQIVTTRFGRPIHAAFWISGVEFSQTANSAPYIPRVSIWTAWLRSATFHRHSKHVYILNKERPTWRHVLFIWIKRDQLDVTCFLFE